MSNTTPSTKHSHDVVKIIKFTPEEWAQISALIPPRAFKQTIINAFNTLYGLNLTPSKLKPWSSTHQPSKRTPRGPDKKKRHPKS